MAGSFGNTTSTTTDATPPDLAGSRRSAPLTSVGAPASLAYVTAGAFTIVAVAMVAEFTGSNLRIVRPEDRLEVKLMAGLAFLAVLAAIVVALASRVRVEYTFDDVARSRTARRALDRRPTVFAGAYNSFAELEADYRNELTEYGTAWRRRRDAPADPDDRNSLADAETRLALVERIVADVTAVGAIHLARRRWYGFAAVILALSAVSAFCFARFLDLHEPSPSNAVAGGASPVIVTPTDAGVDALAELTSTGCVEASMPGVALEFDGSAVDVLIPGVDGCPPVRLWITPDVGTISYPGD